MVLITADRPRRPGVPVQRATSASANDVRLELTPSRRRRSGENALRPRRFTSARWPFVILAAMFALGCGLCGTVIRDQLGPPKPPPLQLFGVQPAPGEHDPVFGVTTPPAREDPADLARAVFATAFFGLGALVSLGALVRPLTVTLNETGFTVQPTLGRATRVRWIDLEHIILLEGSVLARRTPSVAWRLADTLPEASPMARLSRDLWGYDASFSGRFELPVRELAGLMEQYRTKASNDSRRFPGPHPARNPLFSPCRPGWSPRSR